MNTTQTTLTDDEPANTGMTDYESSSNAQTTLAPSDQRGGEGCCPWCLAAAETFNHHDDGSVGCSYCDAAIPVGAAWFERGEKIAVGEKTNRREP